MPKTKRAKIYVRSRAMKPDPRHLAAMLFAAFAFLWIMATLAFAMPFAATTPQSIEISTHFPDDVAGVDTAVSMNGENMR